MEFKDLITEEPAMDKEIEMQRINEEVSTSVQEDATTDVTHTCKWKYLRPCFTHQ